MPKAIRSHNLLIFKVLVGKNSIIPAINTFVKIDKKYIGTYIKGYCFYFDEYTNLNLFDEMSNKVEYQEVEDYV